MSSPPSVIEPARAACSPTIVCSSALLPMPFRPSGSTATLGHGQRQVDDHLRRAVGDLERVDAQDRPGDAGPARTSAAPRASRTPRQTSRTVSLRCTRPRGPGQDFALVPARDRVREAPREVLSCSITSTVVSSCAIFAMSSPVCRRSFWAAGDRLVEQQQPRPLDEHHRDLELLPVQQRARGVIALLDHVDGVQRLGDRADALAPAQQRAKRQPEGRRDVDVLEHRELVEDRRLLKGAPQSRGARSHALLPDELRAGGPDRPRRLVIGRRVSGPAVRHVVRYAMADALGLVAGASAHRPAGMPPPRWFGAVQLGRVRRCPQGWLRTFATA
jgi:hypothetical protein